MSLWLWWLQHFKKVPESEWAINSYVSWYYGSSCFVLLLRLGIANLPHTGTRYWKFLTRDLRFPGQWRFKSMPSGAWHHVVMWKDTNVSEDIAASILREKWVELRSEIGNSDVQKDRDWGPFWQHKHGRRFLPEKVMEASLSIPEGTREGSL